MILGTRGFERVPFIRIHVSLGATRMHQGPCDRPQQECEKHSPSHTAVILALAHEPATELNAGPHARLAIDLAEVPEDALEAERLYTDVVADIETPPRAARASRKHVRCPAGRTRRRELRGGGASGANGRRGGRG